MNSSQPQHFRNRLLTPIQYVKGVGPKLAKLFEKKGILTVEDALYFLPRCYEDRSNLKKISEIKAGSNDSGFKKIKFSCCHSRPCFLRGKLQRESRLGGNGFLPSQE